MSSCKDIQIFIVGSGRQHHCATLQRNSIVRDLKRIVKSRFGIPMFQQNIYHCSRYLAENHVLSSEYDQNTFHVNIPMLSGPEQGNLDLWDEIVCTAIVGNVISTVTLEVKPYWQIGGPRGVISRILERLDEIKPHNYMYCDVQLVHNGKPMNPRAEVNDYCGLSRNYAIEVHKNPYGIVKPIKGSSPKRKKRLVLKLKCKSK